MSEPGAGLKRSAPAALRNREPIARVLAEELPVAGLVLEVASGTGEHIVHFSEVFAKLEWQPSDFDPHALESIGAWRSEALSAGKARNLREPLALDVCASEWPNLPPIAAMLSINLVHISPVAAAEALMMQAARLLPPGAPLILYGPYLENNGPTAPSNLAFDADLRARDGRWGATSSGWMTWRTG